MTGLLILIAIMIIVLGTMRPLRMYLARRSAGRLAQLEFKRQHGARVVELLGRGVAPDERRGSPWMNVRIGGHEASLVAARLHKGRMQAGVQFDELLLPLEIWDTGAADGRMDIEVLEGVSDTDAALLVERLAAFGVDSCTSGTLGGNIPVLLRVQFDDVEDLPTLFEDVARMLDALASLEPPNAR